MGKEIGKHIESTAHNAKLLKILGLCIAALLLFCLGFWLRGESALMGRLGISSGGASSANQTASPDDVTALAKRLNEIDAVINAESLDSYDLNQATELVVGAMIDATGDSYLRYISADRYSSYVDVSTAGYPGVGVLFAEYEGNAYALDVFEGSSAAAAGVMPGDFVVAIDGDRSQAWTATEVINAVQREEGSSVVVIWRRPETLGGAGGEEIATNLTCSDYVEPNVEIQLFENVGYVNLRQITQNSDALVREALVQLGSQGAEAFVLDLRNNAGGYLTKAVDIASLFIKSGVIVEIDTVDGASTKQASGNVATEAPLVVLVNGNTAGASEVLAAALRDMNRATLVGTKTMGKGSVQVTTPLTFGGALRYTAARYISPSGMAIDGVGVTPAITVTLNVGSKDDNQLQVALETAASLVSAE